MAIQELWGKTHVKASSVGSFGPIAVPVQEFPRIYSS